SSFATTEVALDAPNDTAAAGDGNPPQTARARANPDGKATTSATELAQANGIDKSVLAIASPRPYRDREHLRHVANQPCLICGRRPWARHHLRYRQPRALGRKASDEFTVPLCRIHHRLAHRVGNEAAWWRDAGIDPIKVARELWNESRVNQARLRPPQASPAV